MDQSNLTPLQKVGTIVVSNNKMEEKHAFFTNAGTTTYIMRNGAKVLFKLGVVPGVAKPAFVTNIDGYVAELREQISLGHPEIHQVPGYEIVSEEMLDPLNAVKEQAIEDFMKSEKFLKYIQNMKGVGTPEDSKSEPDKEFKGATTASISEGAASSDSMNAGAPIVPPTAPAPIIAPITLGNLGK